MRRHRGDAFPERLVKQGLLSLAVAARMVHRRAYPQQYAIVEPVLSERQLDALGALIASLAPVYTANYRSARYRQLSPEELCGGIFSSGARQLTFPDGRAAIDYLAARVDSASLVAKKLREVKLETGDAAAIRTDRFPPTPTR
jgi:hypothetical protein